jgi:hypothetical protein
MKLSNLVVRAAAIAGLVLATCPVSTAQTRPDPSQFDVIGLKLGMSADEAQAAIRAHDPKILIQAFKAKGVDGKISIQVVHAIKRANPRDYMPSEEIIVSFTQTQPGKAYAIGRSVYFAKGEQPLKTAVLKQLFDKYGSPTESSGVTYNWLFDNSNKPILTLSSQATPQQMVQWEKQSVCHNHNGQSIKMEGLLPLDAEGSPISGPLIIPTSFSAECGVNLTASLSPDITSTNPDLIGFLYQVLFDDRIAVADITKVQGVQRAMQEQLQQQQNKQAAGIKPQL